MEQKPHRQFSSLRTKFGAPVHLSTFVILTLLAGVSIGLNMKIRTWQSGGVYTATHAARGWPVPFQTWGDLGLLVRDGEIQGPILALDLTLVCFFLFIVAVMCELLITRRLATSIPIHKKIVNYEALNRWEQLGFKPSDSTRSDNGNSSAIETEQT